MKNTFKFFKNISCKYYPCHKGIKDINCLFCYCPLYFIKECGGNFKLEKNGYKNCSDCNLPHIPEKGYKYVINKLKKIINVKITF